MATDYVYLGPVPCDESCAQVGESDFRERATKEMMVYMELLERVFPDMQDNNVYVKIKWENHDFGQYGEVVVVYQDTDDMAVDYALMMERELPYHWDSQAKRKLGIKP